MRSVPGSVVGGQPKAGTTQQDLPKELHLKAGDLLPNAGMGAGAEWQVRAALALVLGPLT